MNDDAAQYLLETGSLDGLMDSGKGGTGRKTAADVALLGGEIGDCLSPTAKEIANHAKITMDIWKNELNGSKAEFDRSVLSPPKCAIRYHVH